tara:strand:- start:102 stop:716 length:615 start_codon:yes stop_codon:yes gene_type:complete
MQPNENQSRNPNHPKRGSSIKVNPITELSAIKRIKQQLANKPRDLCLFTLGINTAYRANELVSIKVGQVDYLKTQDRLDLKQSKNKKYRSITLNATAIEAIQNWLEVHPDVRPDAPLFISAKTKLALSSVTITSMVKAWYSKAGLRGNFGSHTLRKTWGYHQRKTFHRPTVLLTQAYGHSSEAQTLAYLCIQREEIEALYSSAL